MPWVETSPMEQKERFIESHRVELGWAPRLRQPVKTLFAVP